MNDVPLSTLPECTAPAPSLPANVGMIDWILLERFLTRREEAAFAALVQRHGPMVLGVCRRMLRDAHHVEDAFQATFLILARKADSIQQNSLGSWLYQVAYRVALRARTILARRQLHEHQLAAASGKQAFPEWEGEPVDV